MHACAEVLKMATIVSKRSGSVRGVEGNVDRILSSLREKSERRRNSAVLQKIQEVRKIARTAVSVAPVFLAVQLVLLYMKKGFYDL